MTDFEVVHAVLSVEPISVDQATAAVVAELVAEHTGEARQLVRIRAAHRIGMLEIGDPALWNGSARKPVTECCSDLPGGIG